MILGLVELSADVAGGRLAGAHAPVLKLALEVVAEVLDVVLLLVDSFG